MKDVESMYGLIEIQLTEAGTDFQSWIQIFPLGTYSHPGYGKIVFTEARVKNFVRNFNARVRGVDLDIDYDHKRFTEKAAGWIRELADRGIDGLWGLVEWTPAAKQSLSDGEYRYFSPEFSDSWVNPKTNQKYTDVLFGGAITNRPHLKDIQPINLSESGQIEEGDNMDKVIQALSALLGVELSEEDSEEVVGQKLSEAVRGLQKPAVEEKAADKLQKLSETNPEIATLLSEREEDRKRIALLEATHRLSETTRQLQEAKSEKFALPPSFTDVMRRELSSIPAEASDKILDALKQLTESGLVPLGSAPQGDPNKRLTERGDLVKKFHEEVDKLTTGEKALSYGDAITDVATKQPELFDAYNDAQLGVR
jgi:phage I-like protein